MRTPYRTSRPVANRRLVRERDRRRWRELATVTATVAVVGTALLAYTSLHLAVTRAGYHIRTLERRLDALRVDQRRLEVEAAVLSSPHRVAERAVRELGMSAPSLEQVIFVEGR